MESIQKNRLLFWALIFLIVVNLSALATYFLFPCKQQVVSCNSESMAPGCVLHKELNLTDQQIGQVDKINEDYRQLSKPISGEIRIRRGCILDELEAEVPDTMKVNRLALEISRLQLQLHHENIRHYLELKKVCDPEQALLLSNLYRELYGCPMSGERKMHKRQRIGQCEE
jgi:periplasmic protein CpxP/Spy